VLRSGGAARGRRRRAVLAAQGSAGRRSVARAQARRVRERWRVARRRSWAGAARVRQWRGVAGVAAAERRTGVCEGGGFVRRKKNSE